MRTRSRSRSDVGLARSSSRYEDPRKSRHTRRRSSDSQSSHDRRGSRRHGAREDSADSHKRSPPRHHRERREQVSQGSAPSKIAPVAANPEAVEDPGDFANFPEIPATSQKNLIARGITKLFPVQYTTFRRITNREDLLVRDLTGSGKTLGFCLPMVELFRRDRLFGGGKPLAMILAPTRELALQISKELEALKHHPKEYNVLTVYGGVDIYPQTTELRRGVDIFVGTTGRVKDHMERRNFDFSNLKFAVLDEADVMLNLGFKEDVEHIMKTIKMAEPKGLQALMFSATVPKWVHQIATMFLKPGYQVVDLVSNLKNKTSRTVAHLAINVPYHNRVSALADILICYGGVGQSIIFTSTKNEANQLLQSEKIKNQIEVMHGDIPQNQREVTLKRFKDKKFQVLVATDVASRGLDIPSVDLVIQVEPPKDPETYIHRSGRTARAGRSGTCITFYTNKHKLMLQHIEQKAGITMQKIGVPQPQQVIQASSMGIVEQLKEVNEKVLPWFGEAADNLIAKNDGDVKKALCQCLALLSGHHKEEMAQRSLLNGQEDCVTFQMTMEKPFYAVSLVWNILRRYCPEEITQNIKGMRCFKDNTGAVFDVQAAHAQRFEDIFDPEQMRNVDFKVDLATELPELKEDMNSYGAYPERGARNMNNHNYPSQRYGGGHQDGRFQGHGNYQSQNYNTRSAPQQGGRPGGRDQSCSVFMGNLGDMDQRATQNMLQGMGLSVSSVRVLSDETGRPKGAAFVDLATPQDYERALRLDGQQAPGGQRRLRVNPAASRPSR